MGDTVSFDEIKKEAKKRERKEWVEDKLNGIKDKTIDTMNWCYNNKESLAIVITCMSGVTKIGKGISRNIALKQERTMKEKFIYDRSLGAYLELKKPLNQKQMKTVLERKDNGEKMANILRDMNLLK